MADEDKTRLPALSGPIEHWCQHPGCKKWGGWGYAKAGGDSDWFCHEHRPEVDKVERKKAS